MEENDDIFLLGYFGWYNVGDDAIGLAILQQLIQRYPRSRIYVTTNSPYFLEKNKIHGDIEAVRFDTISILRTVAKCRRFIIAGGTHLHDEDSNEMRRLKVFLFFSILALVGRLSSKSVVLLGHGINVSKRRFKILLRFVLGNASAISVRDRVSYSQVLSMGFGRKCTLGFDAAALLNYQAIRRDSEKGYGTTLGISILPSNEIYRKEPRRDNALVDKLSMAMTRILRENSELRVRLLIFRTGKRHSDAGISTDVAKRVAYGSNRLSVIPYDGSVSDFITRFSECDAIVGMRYHSLLFSYMLGKPSIALVYQGKCSHLVERVCASRSTCINPEDITTDSLHEKLSSLIRQPTDYMAKLPVECAAEMAGNMFHTKDRCESK